MNARSLARIAPAVALACHLFAGAALAQQPSAAAIALGRELVEAKGANAVIAFRFDTSELGSTWTEICAYGTAVRIHKV